MTQTSTRKHIDGGTVRTIARHSVGHTSDFQDAGILITEWTTYRGRVVFEVCRYIGRSYVRIANVASTEAAAREVANRMWSRDRAALSKTAA